MPFLRAWGRRAFRARAARASTAWYGQKGGDQAANLQQPTRPLTLTPADQALADAQAALAKAQAAVEQERAAVEQERAERARAAKAARIYAKIDRQLAAIAPQLDALLARRRQLEARRIVEPTATPAPAPAPTRAARTRGSARAEGAPAPDQRWKTAKYLFWQAYQRRHKNAAHTQRVLTAAALECGIDQTDTSAANLARRRERLVAQARAQAS